MKTEFNIDDIEKFKLSIPDIDKQNDFRIIEKNINRRNTLISALVTLISYVLCYITHGKTLCIFYIALFLTICLGIAWLSCWKELFPKEERDDNIRNNTDYQKLYNHLDELEDKYDELDQDFLETKEQIMNLLL